MRVELDGVVPVRLRVLVALASLAATTWVGTATATAQTAQTQPGGVRFSSSNMEIDETAESLRVTVERTGALHVSRLIVDFATESGSARGGSDYADTTGTLTFEVGESFKSFAIRVRNDADVEEREQFTVRLSNARGDAPAMGGPMTISIWDDDTPPFDPEATGVATPAGDTAARRSAPARAPIAAPQVAAAPPSASPATVARPPATSVRPAPRPATRVRRASASTARRQVSFRQSPVTPFELRPAATGAPTGPALPARVDPLLALVAGLLLARVGAEVWFRARVEPA